MSTTLEEAHILLKLDMDPAFFQQALDLLRRYSLFSLSLSLSLSPLFSTSHGPTILIIILCTSSQGTRLRCAEKNVGVPLYAFNALQVLALPKNYRPPEGTYKKLQT